MVPLSARLRRRLIVGSLALAASPAVAPAQGSPWLPLDDPAYVWIDALTARGALRDLAALERPYTVDAVRRSLGAEHGAMESPVLRSWAAALHRAVERHAVAGSPAQGSDELALVAVASVDPLITGTTSDLREVMLADGGGGLYPGVAVRGAMAVGPIVAVSRIVADNRLKDDPEFLGKTDRAIAGRVEDAYAAGQWRYGELFVGRLARNWGPAPLHGLQLGHYAYTYDHLFARLGVPSIHLSALIARLDEMPMATDTAARWLAAHRLTGRFGAVEVALSETMLFGGAGRGFDFSFLNPLNVWQLSQYNEREQANVSFGLDVAWRSATLGVWSAQLLYDDFQVDECDPACQEPPSWGLTLSFDGLPLGGTHRWFASYTRVSNLTYRTPAAYERYTVHGIGIGRGFSDYDELRVGADLALVPGAVVRPYAAYRRQGEGDYRLPFPTTEEYATTPEFLAGTPQTTRRVAVSGAAALLGVTVSGDLGYNWVTDAGHTAGATRSGAEGRVRLSLTAPLRFAATFR